MLKGCLTRELFLDQELRNVDLRSWPADKAGLSDAAIRTALRERRWRLVEHTHAADVRAVGHDWPPTAETMVGTARLDNVHRLAERALANGVPGDFAETGVWRGGVTILLRGVLAAHGITDRVVWAADSFEGLPPSNPEQYPADASIDLSGIPALEVSLDQVKANFERYGLLDEQVRFLQGWFADTLPSAPIESLALLRLDGDLYESTIDALTSLYPKLSPGGFVIVDDFGGIAACAQAVHDYRAAHNITDPIETIDWTGVWWQKG